jgi:hypothetical protein
MSKAEEIHYKAVIAADNQEPPKDYCISAHADHFNGFVEGYVEGYHQAEKDNELSWEYISKIINIDQQVCGIMGISNYTHNHQQAMKEILNRFNKERKEK